MLCKALLATLLSTALGWECSSDLGCQLNGKCVSGLCHCRDAWTGANCSELALLPTPKEAGLNLNDTSTWGGNVVKGSDNRYHMYAAYMDNKCGLTSWGRDSKIVHAVSDTQTGKFEVVDTAVGGWSHNPAPMLAPDGTILLYHIGTGTGTQSATCNNAGDCCSNGTSPCGFVHCAPPCDCTVGPRPPDFNLSLTLRYATSPSGPWKVWNAVLPKDVAGNNPSPWRHPNGTQYLVSINDHMALLRADSWRGPYTLVTTGACGSGEDPYIYTDTNGNWHCLYHNTKPDPSVAGGHTFSEDGFTWHMSATPAYRGDYVTYTETGRYLTAKRERPRLLFSEEDGEPVALLNGVASRAAGYNETYGFFLANHNPYPGHFDRTHTHLQYINHSSHY